MKAHPAAAWRRLKSRLSHGSQLSSPARKSSAPAAAFALLLAPLPGFFLALPSSWPALHPHLLFCLRVPQRRAHRSLGAHSQPLAGPGTCTRAPREDPPCFSYRIQLVQKLGSAAMKGRFVELFPPRTPSSDAGSGLGPGAVTPAALADTTGAVLPTLCPHPRPAPPPSRRWQC